MKCGVFTYEEILYYQIAMVTMLFISPATGCGASFLLVGHLSPLWYTGLHVDDPSVLASGVHDTEVANQVSRLRQR